MCENVDPVCTSNEDCGVVSDGCFTFECETSSGQCVEIPQVNGEPCLTGPCDPDEFGACNADAQCGGFFSVQ